VVGRGSRMWLQWLGMGGPAGNGWDVGCFILVGGRVNCCCSIREPEGVGLLSIDSMLADMSAMALDMSAIALSRRSVA